MLSCQGTTIFKGFSFKIHEENKFIEPKISKSTISKYQKQWENKLQSEKKITELQNVEIRLDSEEIKEEYMWTVSQK